MSHKDTDHWQGLSADERDRLDRACDEFERRFERGDDERFEIDLDSLTDAAREIFVREIVTIDVELRRQRGEDPKAEDYAERLPGFAASITKAVSPPSPSPEEMDGVPHVPGYQLLEKIGEGGMGVVYLAEQRGSLRRRVALKFLQPKMHSLGFESKQVKEIIGRFEAERQALALMDHDAIAKVYDAGETSEGHPYFAMEFVSGVPVTEYCDQHRLGIEERLRLFVQICQATHHAHQRGVLHRDLKPGNILVAQSDGEPRAKIYRFRTRSGDEPAIDREDNLYRDRPRPRDARVHEP